MSSTKGDSWGVLLAAPQTCCSLSALPQAPDFYVEMKWEFTSWGEWGVPSSPRPGPGSGDPCDLHPLPAVPLVSKMCPSDVYRVWKRGESLRVDTTLLGFEHMTWQRGRRSFIFRGQGEPVREGGIPLPLPDAGHPPPPLGPAPTVAPALPHRGGCPGDGGGPRPAGSAHGAAVPGAA